MWILNELGAEFNPLSNQVKNLNLIRTHPRTCFVLIGRAVSIAAIPRASTIFRAVVLSVGQPHHLARRDASRHISLIQDSLSAKLICISTS